MLYIYSPRPSNGARELAEELGVRRLKENGRYILRSNDVVINWGSASALPVRCASAKLVNDPAAISEVSNKLTFFNKMEGVKVNDKRVMPKFFTTREQARDFLRDKGGAIVCRTVLSGSGGRGIVIADSEGQLVDAELYVRYVAKQSEWRCHFVGKTIIDTQRKAKRLDAEVEEWRIRNLDNGFIYARDASPPANVRAVAEKVVEVTSLDFGAIDLIYNAQSNRAYCLEINSAPGLQGQTVVNYANAFRSMLQ
jgi:glutathione synthase/RimK-type ligase-like ATP-grasp enzyme